MPRVNSGSVTILHNSTEEPLKDNVCKRVCSTIQEECKLSRVSSARRPGPSASRELGHAPPLFGHGRGLAETHAPPKYRHTSKIRLVLHNKYHSRGKKWWRKEREYFVHFLWDVFLHLFAYWRCLPPLSLSLLSPSLTGSVFFFLAGIATVIDFSRCNIDSRKYKIGYCHGNGGVYSNRRVVKSFWIIDWIISKVVEVWSPLQMKWISIPQWYLSHDGTDHLWA